ncbi:MAG: hypothetical protein ACLPY1_05705 [Terracidiphilus sp.]
MAYIEVVEAVVVEVASGNAIVGVDVNANRSVQYGAPVVCATQNLFFVGLFFSESLGSNVEKRRPLHDA